LPVDLRFYPPIRVAFTHGLSVDEDVAPREPDAGVGFNDKGD
jgi:hypothetical protein